MAGHKRKVLHVISGLRAGGAENMLALMLENKKADEFHHYVISVTPGGVTRERIEKCGYKVYDLGMCGLLSTIPAVLRLVGLIKKIQPDIVQGWMYHGDFFSTIALLLSGRRKRTKLYWGVRCSNLKFDSYSLQLRMTIRLCVLLSRVPDMIISNSYAGTEFHKSIGYKNKFFIIENGVNPDVFSPNEDVRSQVRKELNIGEDNLVFIMSARIDPMKNHSLFIRTIKKLEHVKAIIAGEGTDSLAKVPNIYLLGLRKDMNRLYAASDVLVSVSSFGEGFSNSIAEAMAAGLPIIATDVGDSRLIVDDCGYIIKPDNEEELTKAIYEFLNSNSDNRTNLGQCARKRIVENYTIQSTIEKFSRVYSA